MKGPVYVMDKNINEVASTTSNQVLHYQKHYYICGNGHHDHGVDYTLILLHHFM